MRLSGVAKETLAIIGRGTYVSPSGRQVSIAAEVSRAKAGTRLYRPAELAELASRPLARTGATHLTQVEVTSESTSGAGHRLVRGEGEARVFILNFASAKNPGGGFLGGARAQEEDLARASALYACQLTQPEYYAQNRACGTLLYTDHMIYSPDVPFFRDDAQRLLEEPYLLSVLTAPAPNAGEHRRRDDEPQAVEHALRTRAAHVLRVARSLGHEVLVLGAWGCGVFRNEPAFVANVFAALLASDELRGAFRRVVFAIFERSKTGATRRLFEERLLGGASST